MTERRLARISPLTTSAGLALVLSMTIQPSGRAETQPAHSQISELGAIAHRFLSEISFIGSRRAGTENELAAGRWLATHLRRVGLDVRVEAVAYDAYLPQRVELVVEGHSGEPFESAFAAWRTRPTGAAGVNAPLLYVGHGVAIDAASRARFLDARGDAPGGFPAGRLPGPEPTLGDVAGRIVVAEVERVAGYLDLNGKAVYHAARRGGAAGCILIDRKPLNTVSPHSLKMSGPTELADLPAIVIGADDGARLRAMIEAGATHARMIVDASVVPWQSENVFALVPGASDAVVLITSPHDAFFEGATDSGAGLAALATLAEHYARRACRTPPAKTLLFLSTTGHYAAGGAGVRAFIERHRDRIERDMLVNVHLGNGIAGAECEAVDGVLVSTGRDSPRQLFLSSHPFLSAVARSAVLASGLTQTLLPVPAAVFNIGEHSQFAELGVGHVAIMGAPSYADTRLDTLDKVSPEMMSSILQFATAVIDGILGLSDEQIRFRLEPASEAVPRAAAGLLAGDRLPPPSAPVVSFRELEAGHYEFEASPTEGVRLAWDFGDGSPPSAAAGSTIRHRYLAAGEYEVTTVAVDVLGLATHTRTRIHVSDPR